MRGAIFAFLLAFAVSVSAQVQVQGTVVDEFGDPVTGATIQVQGVLQGATTDLEGNFTLSAPAGGTLVVSFIGYVTQTVPVSANVGIIRLEPDIALLDEVVVTGFTQVRRSSFTGAATTVSTTGLENVPSVSFATRLAGAAPGVQIGAAGGQPGAVESFRIRGTGSVSASSEPLFVVDGVPMIRGNLEGFGYSHSGSSVLSTINPNDIESVTIIKDAAAAALFGSRAANGVVVITTRSGRAGRTNVTFRADVGFSNMAVNYRPTLDGDARKELILHGLTNRRLINVPTATPAEARVWAEAENNARGYAIMPWMGHWEDWRSLLFRTGTQQNYEVSVSGGNERTTFFTSLSYSSVEGITIRSSLERFTGRVNLTHRATDRFSLNANVALTNSTQNVNSEGTAFASPIMAIAMSTGPQDNAFNPDGTFNLTERFLAIGPHSNPLNTATVNFDENIVNRMMGTLSADFNATNWLTLRQRINYDFIHTDNNVWWDPRSGDGRTSIGVMQRLQMHQRTFIAQSQALFNHTFNERHNIDGVLAFETEDYRYDEIYAHGSNFPTPQLNQITNAGTTRSSSFYTTRRMMSYISSINYNFDHRYYVGLSFRRDGSSRFHRDNRWGNFWAVSGSWRLSEEEFMQSISHILPNARIRASYGTSGNQPLQNFGFMDMYGFGFRYNSHSGSAPSQMPYPELTWEQNRQVNVGLDFSLINRFNVTFDVYQRWADGLLLSRNISQTTGFVNMLMNVGSIENRGFDLSVTSHNIRTRDMTWSTTLNLNHNRNKLTRIDGVAEQFQQATVRLMHRVGEPFNSIFAFEYAGVCRETGRELFYTNRGENPRATTANTAEADQVIIGKVDPDIIGGLTNNFRYRNFDLGFTFTFTLGGNLYDNATWLNANGGGFMNTGNIPARNRIEDMWTPENRDARLPRYVHGNTHVASSRWMYSSDHLRLKNITMGYSLPDRLFASSGINRVRFYASAVNLFTIMSSDLPFDPEPPIHPTQGSITMGIVTFQTPPLRSVTFGVEVSF